ncbi:MAG: hypothetical protein GY953_38270 [bacterium]|nr:hypothetical protein [bacterium]
MRKHWQVWLLGAILLVHFVWLACYVVPAYASPDADGYFAQARLIATTGRVTFAVESPLQYLGMHWLEGDNGAFISRYPPGFPIVLASVWATAGRAAIFYVNPLLATLTLLFLFLLCRPYVGGRLALVGTAVFAVNPLANFHAIHSDAHTASTFFLVTGLAMLDSWLRQGKWWRALPAGLLLGAVPAMRYAEAVAGIGVVALVLLNWNRLAGRRRELAVLVAAAAVPFGLLLLHNQAQFGAFWKTGYALTNEQQIRWEYFRDHWQSYLGSLLGSSVGPFFVVGVAGLAGMFTRRETRPLATGLSLVIGLITVVYAGYYFNRGMAGGASVRFLLPTLPLYVLPAMWLFRQFASTPVARAALGALLAVHLLHSVPTAFERMTVEKDRARGSAASLAWIEEHIPEGSILVGDRGVQESVHFAGKWKLADASLFNVGSPRGRMRAGFRGRMFGEVDEAPMPMQRGKAEEILSRYRDLPPGEAAELALADLRDWAGGREVYWLGDAAAMPEVRVEQFGAIKMPEPDFPAPSARGRRRGPGPGGMMPGGPPPPGLEGFPGRRRGPRGGGGMPSMRPPGEVAVYRLIWE